MLKQAISHILYNCTDKHRQIHKYIGLLLQGKFFMVPTLLIFCGNSLISDMYEPFRYIGYVVIWNCKKKQWPAV